MGIKANFINLLYFTGRLAPMMVVFFFVLTSIINKDWRGVIYLSGVITSCFITIMFSNTFESSFVDSSDKSYPVCNFTEREFSKFPLSSVILAFTIMYLLLPMIKVYGSINNYLLFTILMIFIGVDIFFLIRNKCSTFGIFDPEGGLSFVNSLIPIMVSYIIGFFIGQIYVLVLNSTNNGDLLYYNEKTTKPMCNLTSSNKFVCKVYKNGELVSST